MISIIVVSIVFGSLIALATLICGTVLVLLKTRSRTPRGADNEEARVIQEIYQGLERMEERIESLETILMADQEKDGYKK
ncbi:MAG TPA: hypothetical protein DDY32_01630 [Desulfobulbaceae bacterium]|nr:hypothetical protein [Desulfobulbaceae bacterium]